MAAIAMWRHNKRQTGGEISKERLRRWLKTLTSLVVVMGLTWIFGVLIVEVEELVHLAYIYTIMVAFQGLFIFLILVVYPKEVRDTYVKLLRKNLKKIFTEKDTKEVSSWRWYMVVNPWWVGFSVMMDVHEGSKHYYELPHAVFSAKK